ncbi:MAG: DUF559 domain-containing protein [Acidimicrobiia bacterium]
MADADRVVAELAAQQAGAFSYGQVRAVGFSDRMIEHRIRNGRWRRLEKSVFAVAGTPDTHEQHLFVAALAAGPGGAISHRTAAELHGIGRFRQPIEIITPRPRRYRTAHVIVHTSKKLGPIDIELHDQLPVTTVARTLIDLGAVVHPDRVEDALDVALRERLVALGELKRRLTALRKSGRGGTGVMADILERRDPASMPESRYERLFLRAIEMAGLPLPELQVEIRDGERFLGRVDAAWPERRLAVEVDGHRFHATRKQRAADATRENAIKLAGWRVLRFTTDQVWQEPAWVARTIAKALGHGAQSFPPPGFSDAYPPYV